MNKRIRLWDFNGYVYLEKSFINLYKRRIKEFGVTKLSNKLNVCYDTIAGSYRRDKLISIKLLEKICSVLNINKKIAEKAAKCYTQNLKNKYSIEFPIRITPLHLRAISMIMGDGSGSLDKCCKWSQKSCNFQWGTKLIEATIKNKCGTFEVSNCDCKNLIIPNFLVRSIAIMLELRSNKIKSYEFFEKVCKLPREWQFQVFAQFVVDEGSPDSVFIISQWTKDVKEGVMYLINKLGYHFTNIKNGIYIHTESLPHIKEDLENAKKCFGELGGFWFKNERFELACHAANPDFSKNSRLYNESFLNALKEIKKSKTVFTYRELKGISSMPKEALTIRIRKALKNRNILRIGRGIYSFYDFINDENIKWLALPKEEKILKIISKSKHAKTSQVLNESKLSASEFYRAIYNLIGLKKIQRVGYGVYKLNYSAQ